MFSQPPICGQNSRIDAISSTEHLTQLPPCSENRRSCFAWGMFHVFACFLFLLVLSVSCTLNYILTLQKLSLPQIHPPRLCIAWWAPRSDPVHVGARCPVHRSHPGHRCLQNPSCVQRLQGQESFPRPQEPPHEAWAAKERCCCQVSPAVSDGWWVLTTRVRAEGVERESERESEIALIPVPKPPFPFCSPVLRRTEAEMKDKV